MFRRVKAGRGLVRKRLLHTQEGELYVHHTVAGVGKDRNALMLGLMHVIGKLNPGTGFFRPIDCTTVEGERCSLMKRAFRLPEDACEMRGLKQDQAWDFLLKNQIDDLLEKIFVAYTSYKRKHNFVLLEGTHLKSFGTDVHTLNAQIASAIGAPVLLLTDASLLARKSAVDLSVEVSDCTRASQLVFSEYNARVLGGVVHQTPPSQTRGIRETFEQKLATWNVPLMGVIPADPALQTLEGEKYASEASSLTRVKKLCDEHIDLAFIQKTLSTQERSIFSNPFLFKHSVFRKAAEYKQRIILPEGDEPRTLQASAFILKHDICDLILMGPRDKITSMAKENQVDLNGAKILDCDEETENARKYATVYYEARKHKGVTMEQAFEILKRDRVTLATCMIASGDADGMVSGAVHTTADTIRPALQVIRTEAATPIVSSVFFICLRDKVLVYADVAVNTSPSSEELAVIAISSARTAAAFGMEPRIAMLSYATGNSNSGPMVQKVAEAVNIARSKCPDLIIDGPLQYDAAVNWTVANIKLKAGSSAVAGQANVLVFPDLNSSNIACKAVQQHTGAVAIGPILQGLRKPVNDLSRGCTVKDIAATIAATAVQALHVKQSAAHMEAMSSARP